MSEEENKYENDSQSYKQKDDDNELVNYHKKDHGDDDEEEDEKPVEQDEYQESQDEDYTNEEDKNHSKKNKKKLIGGKRVRDKKKKKKKKRRKEVVAEFLDVQAEEDEDEDDGSIGEFTKEQDELGKKFIEKYDQIHSKNKRLKLTDENVEEIGKIYQQREYVQDDDDEEDDYEKRDMRPSKDDPKLWLIKCKVNEEKECLANLYHKYIYFSKKEPKDRLKIFSIISFDNLKGKIFIEAYSEKDVINAVSGLTTLNERTIKIIPLNEMTQIFDFDKYKKINIQKNQLVRIKNGVYKDDLAKVIRVDDPINKIYIAVVPRVYEEVNNKDFNVVDSMKKQRESIRPRQKLFDAEKYGANKFSDEKFDNYIQFGKKKFIDGLLIKVVRASSIETENVLPKNDEIQKLGCFVDENGQYYDKNNTDIPLKISNRKTIEYKKGDRIKFLEGEFKNCKGKVISQDGNKVIVSVDIMDEGSFSFNVSDIALDYNLGDIVSVINGPNKGKSGYIIKFVDNFNAVIYNDLSETKFNVNTRDIILSSELPFQNDENTMFKIGELVKINNSNIICYVIDSSKYTIKVVTVQNELKSLSVREVEKLNLNKRVTSIDCKRNPIAKDNSVKVINGPNKGSRGTIKNIYKKFVFLHDIKYSRTNGIFCEINENLELLGSELLRENSDKGKVNNRVVPEVIKKLLGETVHVVKGNWKGYNGIVKEVNDKFIKLELSAKQKSIQLPFEYVSEGTVNSPKNEDGSFSQTPNNLTMKTPAHYREYQEPLSY